MARPEAKVKRIDECILDIRMCERKWQGEAMEVSEKKGRMNNQFSEWQ